LAIDISTQLVNTTMKKEIGEGIKEAINEGLVKREELYITTKVWNDAKDDVEKSLSASLADLQLNYVDLFLIHWPIGVYDKETKKLAQIPLHITWEKMEDCVKKGLSKSIGVSNFNVQILLNLLSYAKIKPAVNQIELHPYLVQEDLVNFCLKYGIQIEAYSPLCGGGLTAFGEVGPSKDLLNETVLKQLAAKYKKSVSQIVLNWHLSRGYVIIPKTSTLERLRENWECDGFEMEKGDLEKVSGLDCGFRNIDPRLISVFDKIPLFN